MEDAIRIMELVKTTEEEIGEIIGLPIEITFSVNGYRFELMRESPKTDLIEDIVNIVGAILNVAPADFFLKTRRRPYVEARQMAFKLIRLNCDRLSYKQIGQYFDVDHSTVMYGIDTINDLLVTDGKIRMKYMRIEQKVKERMAKYDA